MPNSVVNVLLIEDDDVDTEAMQRAFDKLHIANKITIATDRYEALNILRGEGGHERLPSPYVILLDVQLPRMNGIEFLRILRGDRKLRSSVVFVLTTSRDEQDMMAAYSEQVAGYFIKKNAGQEFRILPEMIRNYWQMTEWPRNGIFAS